jgi:hypothetical protein
MADFQAWIEAAEPALPWENGEFTEAYTKNRTMIVRLTLESDVVANVILELMESRDEWQGTASELLEKLEVLAGDQVVKSKYWPKAPHILSRRLTTVSSFLNASGVLIERSHRTADKRNIRITSKPLHTTIPSLASSYTNGKDSEHLADDGKNDAKISSVTEKDEERRGLKSNDANDATVVTKGLDHCRTVWEGDKPCPYLTEEGSCDVNMDGVGIPVDELDVCPEGNIEITRK